LERVNEDGKAIRLEVEIIIRLDSSLGSRLMEGD
jgi:hypothetical protein